ncbi:glycosyltransferase [Phenylobacterium sp.]|uniref:glycosyltransferase n=1 Tax=Phenylobacterium sp. TaxID=1871053 RepID=UPI003D2B0596
MLPSRPVVLFCGALAGDGVARNTVHLANALSRRGVPVEVVCLRGGALAADLRGPDITCLGSLDMPRPLALAAAIPALRRRLRTIDASLAVSMGNHAHLALWAALRGLPDVPRIYRISNDVSHGKAFGRMLGLRLVAADATRLVCVSRQIAAASLFRRARRDRRLDILPNGVDAEAVRGLAGAQAWHPWLVERAPYLVAVGRLHRQKNYEALIDALAQLRASGHPHLRLLVLGAAPPRAQTALTARARMLGLSQVVRFEGEVTNPFPLVRHAVAYVLPSLWEGASNSLLEAIACGVPVVASRKAGNAADVLGDGRYGVLAEPTDVDDLAAAIALQLDPRTRVLPAARADELSLDAVVSRLSAVVLAARLEHDGNHMRPEAGGHLEPLSSGMWGTKAEYSQ